MHTPPRVFVKTLGCKVNTYDSHALENQFKAHGYTLVNTASDADVTVINTCSVTSNAEKEARYLLRRFRRDNPAMQTVVTGCYAQVDSARLMEMPEVDFVVPNESKEQLVALVSARLATPAALELGSLAKFPSTAKPVRDNRQQHFKSSLTLFDNADSSQTRAFLKIQDGCNGFCTYCLIPYARGASRSVPPDQVLKEVRRLSSAGMKELVLTGIHIGDYGEDLETEAKTPFVRLLQSILEINASFRLRISSLEPRELTEEFLQLMQRYTERFCDHLHLPLQSGSDRILKLMRRTYDTTEYADKVAMARSYFPNINIGADVIPGFPSETAEDHANTVAFIERTGLNYLHVFPYSARPNTAAGKMPGHLPGDIVKARAAELRALSKAHLKQYQQRFLGVTVSVIWEHTQDAEGRRMGHSANYLDVLAPASYAVPPGTVSQVKLKGFVENDRLLGIPLQDHSAGHRQVIA